MARKKNLERAIVLGLILSTGVYGSAWAEDYAISDFRNLGNEISITEDTTVIGTGIENEGTNSIANKIITVSDGITLKLENLTGHSPNIAG